MSDITSRDGTPEELAAAQKLGQSILNLINDETDANVGTNVLTTLAAASMHAQGFSIEEAMEITKVRMMAMFEADVPQEPLTPDPTDPTPEAA